MLSKFLFDALPKKMLMPMPCSVLMYCNRLQYITGKQAGLSGASQGAPQGLVKKLLLRRRWVST